MQILNYQKVDRLANTLAILGDPVRLSIVVYLIGHTANVTEITEYLKMSQPAISHHLRLLKTSGILKSEKKGKLVYYSLVDEHVKNIIESGLVHTSNGE